MTGFNSKKAMANDKIKGTTLDELMYQSGITANGCWDEMDDYDKQAIEKFAELIVKECINVLDPGDHQLIARFHTRQWLSEHFGVK